MRNKVIGALVTAAIGVTGLVGVATPASSLPLDGQVVSGFSTLATCNAGRAEWRNRGYIVGNCQYTGVYYLFIAKR